MPVEGIRLVTTAIFRNTCTAISVVMPTIVNAPKRSRAERQPIAPDDQQGEQGDDDARADEAHLLADDGEDVVVLLLGQIGKLLAAHAEAETAQAAGGHGVEGLDDLMPLSPGSAHGFFHISMRLPL